MTLLPEAFFDDKAALKIPALCGDPFPMDASLLLLGSRQSFAAVTRHHNSISSERCRLRMLLLDLTSTNTSLVQPWSQSTNAYLLTICTRPTYSPTHQPRLRACFVVYALALRLTSWNNRTGPDYSAHLREVAARVRKRTHRSWPCAPAADALF